MAMAMRSPSPALQYPDSDAEQEGVTTLFADADDHEDEMVTRFANLE